MIKMMALLLSITQSYSKHQTLRRHSFVRTMSWILLLLLLLSWNVRPSQSFFSSSATVVRPHGKDKVTINQQERHFLPTTGTTMMTRTFILHLVTEEDVLEAVEDAEKLWAQALEARKTANALSDRAEEEAEATAESAKEIDALFQTQRQNQQSITMQQLAKADTVARTNLDAGNLVNRALKAAEEADYLETLAEDALKKSEDRLEQHLKDFPNSSLAQ